MTLKLVSGFFCDDIRHEVGGKHTAVGIYGNSVYFSKLPTNFVVKLGLFGKSTEKGRYTISVSLRQNRKQIANASVALTINETGQGFLPLSLGIAQLSAGDIIELFGAVGEARFKKITELEVHFKPEEPKRD